MPAKKRARSADDRPHYINRSGKRQKTLYMTDEQHTAITEAAAAEGVSAVQFIVNAAEKAAAKVLRGK